MKKIIKWIRLLLLSCLSRHYKVGLSIILSDEILIEDGVSIGNFNFINCNKLILKKNAKIGKFNRITGGMNLIIEEGGWLDHKVIASASKTKMKSRDYSTLHLMKNSHVISGFFNLTDSIIIGERSIIAGTGSEFWTHSFYLSPEKTIRVDGRIIIGNDCYIGSRCIFMPGLKVADNITVGAGCCVSKSLLISGTYVSQPLRYIETTTEKSLKKFGDPVEAYTNVEFYRKEI